jgi:hypothetical protein
LKGRCDEIHPERLFLTLVLAVLLLFGVPGCTGDRIPEDQVAYFQSLRGARYWTKTAVNLVVLDAAGKSVTLLDNVQPGEEAYLVFKGYSLTLGSPQRPRRADLAVTGSNGSSALATTNIDVTSSNMAALKAALKNMEPDKARTERLDAVRLAKEAEDLATNQKAELQQVMKDATALQKKGRYGDAIARLDSLRTNRNPLWSYEQGALYSQLVSSEVDRILRLCQLKDDAFKKIQFFTSDKDQGSRAFRFFPYLAKDASGSWWFLRLTLYRDDWLFANQVQVIVSGTVYSTVVKESFSEDIKTDVLYGGVYECVSFRQADAGSDTLFRAIAGYTGASALKVRVNGDQHYSEYSLSLADVQVWRDMLFLYSRLNDYTFSN